MYLDLDTKARDLVELLQDQADREPDSDVRSMLLDTAGIARLIIQSLETTRRTKRLVEKHNE